MAIGVPCGIARAIQPSSDRETHIPGSTGLPPRPAVTWVPALHMDPRPPGARVRYIIIHDTETPGVSEARVIARHFRNPRAEVSAHFIIGKRGEVVQCVPETWRAWHAGESYLEGADHLNDESVGIELVNAQTGHDPFPDAQLDSLERLLSHLMVKHGVTWTHVLGHRQVTLKPDVKRDPADNFPWNRVAARVADRIAAFRSKGLANVGQH
jgi:N-acetylmuramoyl-L-alanine amidase